MEAGSFNFCPTLINVSEVITAQDLHKKQNVSAENEFLNGFIQNRNVPVNVHINSRNRRLEEAF